MIQPPTGVRALTHHERGTLRLYAVNGFSMLYRGGLKSHTYSNLAALGLIAEQDGRWRVTDLGRRVASEQGIR